MTFAIFDFDRFSRHDQIGEVQVPLGQVDFGKVIQEWRDVCPPAGDNDKVKTYLELFFGNNNSIHIINRKINLAIFVFR